MSNLTGDDFVSAVERGLKGLTAVSTGICPGCEQCRDEYTEEVTCATCGGEGYVDGGIDGQDCPDCEGDGTRELTMEEFREAWSTGEIHAEASFSWSGCDICGSTLGGSFEPWHGIDDQGDIMHGEHACVDCIMYLANGDLPE